MLALLAGCTLGPHFRQPSAGVPLGWHEAALADAARWPAAEWWRGFGSRELDDCLAQAQRSNYDLAAAAARVRQADALATVAGAALLPDVNASATALGERVQSTSANYSNFRQYSPQLSASYMIDFWGRNRAAQAAAVATATASRHDRATIELSVMSAVALSYFQVIELRERVAVAQDNVQAAQTTLRGLRMQREAGIATALDVAQQEATVATLDAAIAPLEQQERQGEHALAVLLGQAPGAALATGTTLADLDHPLVQPGLPSELLLRRPDVAQAQDQLVAANANIAAARAAFFPQITLTASGGFASSALSTVLQSSSGVHELAAGLVQPIFDGGALHGQYEYAKARYDELVADYRKAVLTALADVEDALVAVQQTQVQVQRQQAAAARAQRAYDIAQAQLRSGTVSILTVLNTESALFGARDALAQARYAQMAALVGLYTALGGGWQQEPDA